MVSKREDRIDFARLEEELNAAVEADAKYWRENDAKFRAVNQKVATYEEFRDIVQASHLKPLEKGDKISAESFKQRWNSSVSSRQANDRSAPDTTSAAPQNNMKGAAPRSAHEFMRAWRVADSSLRRSIILDLGPRALSKLFSSEVDSTLLAQIIGVLGEGWRGVGEVCSGVGEGCSVVGERCSGVGEMERVLSVADVERVLSVVEALTAVQRFELSISLMSGVERQACAAAFSNIRSVLEQQKHVAAVQEQHHTVAEQQQREHSNVEQQQETIVEQQQQEFTPVVQQQQQTIVEQQQKELTPVVQQQQHTIVEQQQQHTELEEDKGSTQVPGHELDKLNTVCLLERLRAVAKCYNVCI